MLHHSRSHFFVAIDFLLAISAGGALEAQTPRVGDNVCRVVATGQDHSKLNTDTTLADKTFVRALAIYVAFADQPSHKIPPVASRLEVELPNFMRSMSEGRQTLLVETALRPAPFDSLCYVADSSMSYYQSKIPEPAPKTTGFDFITDEILDKVAADHPDFPTKYEVIFLNLLGNFQKGSDGFSRLVVGKRWERKFSGMGATMDLTDPEVFIGVVAHEYGHLLGAQHPPNFLEKSYGDYELMDQHLHRLAPYGLQNLMDIGWIAPERVQVVTDTLYNIALEDIRRGGKVLLIAMNTEQYLLVANHQGTDYDAVYKNRGLLIWHQGGKTATQRAYSIWDLESAAGLLRAGHADPIFGQDDFDRSRDSTGSAADFFNPTGVAHFSPETNPNTNLYDQAEQLFDWRVQSRPSGITLTNLRQQGRTILLDVFVPLNPPRIVLVKGPNAVIEPNSFYGVNVWLANDNPEYEVEILYRYLGVRDFENVKMQRIVAGHFSGEISLQRVGTEVQYYVRATDSKGRQELYPPSAPDSLLSFIVKPSLGNMITMEPRVVTLAAGDSVEVPFIINNSSDLFLSMRSLVLQQETLDDDRAYDSSDSAVAHEIYAPKIFLNPQTEGNFGLYYERAPALYLRIPSFAHAVGKLHLTYDEHWVYLYFVMLKPRSVDFPFSLELVWRDSGFVQQAWLTVTGASLDILTQPKMPMTAAFLGEARGSLPSLLIKLSAAHLLRSTPLRNMELRAAFWSDRYNNAKWPSVALPDKFGKIFWCEDSPYFQLRAYSDQMSPGEQRMRSVRFKAPRQPWAAELRSWLLIQLESPLEARQFIPLVIKIKEFHSRYGSSGDPEPKPEIRLDPKPNYGADSSNAPPIDFRVVGGYPSPFHASDAIQHPLRLRFLLSNADLLHVQIFDVLGRRVVELVQSEFTAGEHELLWNGRDASGQNMPRGIYFIRFTTSTKTAFVKIVVI